MPGTISAALDRRRLHVVFGGLMLAMALGALDQAIVATALPVIVADLGGLEHLSWVVTSYLLAATASTPLWGKLGDLYGRKRTFLVSIATFIAGSTLCALSTTMLHLIGARALQGIGGGGLIVTSQAVIGDIVSPRERGRYQGIFGAVFATSSVIGPMLGGFFVDFFTWHWVFLINLPIGTAAFAVIAAALPATARRIQHRIDYAGAAAMTISTTCLVLVMTLGGVQYSWTSFFSFAFATAGILFAVVFLAIERRVEEPILPPRLFGLPVFRLASTLSFLIGAALLGPITVLPLFMQVVYGVSPTESGTRMLPLLLAVPVSSIVSGQVISRTGRYRIFPIAGTGLMSLGLFLMSLVGAETDPRLTSFYMAVLGLGLGMVMQVLILSVQNTVEYRDLGAATSGVTFFRSMGGVFGVALFGGIFASRVAGVTGEAQQAAYVAALHAVFTVAFPCALAGLLLAFRLEEVPLRETATAPVPESAITPTMDARSAEEIERILGRLIDREERQGVYERLAARAGVALPPIGCWLLFRLDEFSPAAVSTLAQQLPIPHTELLVRLHWLEELGLISLRAGTAPTDPVATLTEAGQEAVSQLARARRERLESLARGWHPERYPELEDLLRRLARVMVPDLGTGSTPGRR